MDPKRLQTIKEWENYPPKSYRDLQVLLGFCNFYRRFIRGYSAIAQPLTTLLKGSKDGRKSGHLSREWGSQQQEAFLTLLRAFQTTPLLRHYDLDLPLRLEADASDVALGGVLSQLQKDTNQQHPIAFFSRQFKGAEVNYSTPDKELMAIVECFKHWRYYLEGSQYTTEVWSDHQNLQGFMKQPRINGRQARWLIYLTPYDFIIKHRPGLLNPADGPSRRPDYMAQKEPSLVQKSLLESKLVSTAPDLPKVARLNSTLCDIAKCQLCKVAASGLTGLLDSTPCDMARPKPGFEAAGSEPFELPKADNTVKAAQRANASRPLVESEGRWDLDNRDTIGLRTPTATVQVLCALPRAEDKEVGHLLELVRLQATTRREAKIATQEEKPLSEKTAPTLLATIRELQGTDPLCIRLRKELLSPKGDSRKGYSLDQEGLLFHKERVLVPYQKSLIQELLYLYHDDQFTGHQGIDKTKELLERKFYQSSLAQDVREYVATCSTY